MKKICVIIIALLSLISVGAFADEQFVFAKDVDRDNSYFSSAQSPEGKTIVLTWEYSTDFENSEVKVLVIKYNSKGKYKSKKPFTISSDKRSYKPFIAYNPDSEKYLLVWRAYVGNNKNEIKGRILNSVGKVKGMEFSIFSGPFSSFSGEVVAPLTNKQFGNSKSGDFLVGAGNYDLRNGEGVFQTVQINSDDLSISSPMNIGSKRLIGADILTTDKGMIVLLGIQVFSRNDNRPDELGIQSFTLNGRKLKYVKLTGEETTPDQNVKITELSKKNFLATWPLEEDAQTLPPKSRLVKSNIKPVGKEMALFGDDRGNVQEFAKAEDGRNFVLFINIYRKMTVSEISGKGKLEDEIRALAPDGLYPYEASLHWIEENQQLLVIYFTETEIMGYVFNPNDDS